MITSTTDMGFKDDLQVKLTKCIRYFVLALHCQTVTTISTLLLLTQRWWKFDLQSCFFFFPPGNSVIILLNQCFVLKLKLVALVSVRIGTLRSVYSKWLWHSNEIIGCVADNVVYRCKFLCIWVIDISVCVCIQRFLSVQLWHAAMFHFPWLKNKFMCPCTVTHTAIFQRVSTISV